MPDWANMLTSAYGGREHGAQRFPWDSVYAVRDGLHAAPGGTEMKPRRPRLHRQERMAPTGQGRPRNRPALVAEVCEPYHCRWKLHRNGLACLH